MNDISEEEITFFLFAGEASGDLNGVELLKELQKRYPKNRFLGVGGPKMRAQHFESLIPMEEFQVMGFTEVLTNLPRLWDLFQQTLNHILETRPDIIILIDFPDFNIRLAKALRKRNFSGKIVQYISPTVWAWKKNRIRQLDRYFDMLLTILPFEPQYFKDVDLDVKYVGNPIIKTVDSYQYSENWIENCQIPTAENLLGIFPGSRKNEILMNLHKQLAAAESYLFSNPQAFIGIAIAHGFLFPVVEDLIHNDFPELRGKTYLIPPHHVYDLMRSCRAAIATSGTVNLELALHGIPTVSVYNMTPVNWFLAKYLFRIKLPFYCITNIICEREVFPEVIGKDISSFEIANKLEDLVSSSKGYMSCIQGCKQLRDRLTNADASAAAAQAIGEFLSDD